MSSNDIVKARTIRIFAQWSAYLTTVTTFISEHDRMPSKRSEDLDEMRSAQWLTSQRSQLKAGTLSTEKQAALDLAIPNWRAVRTADDRWYPPHAVAAAFVAEHSRVPHPDAEDEAERTAGRWVAKQRKNAESLDQEKQDLLDRTVPGWRHLPAAPARRKRVAAGPAPAFDYEREEFLRWPFHVFDFLHDPRRQPTTMPEWNALRGGHCDDDLSAGAFDEHLELLIASVYDVFPRRRPNRDGALALFTWVEWAELEMGIGDRNYEAMQEFHTGLLTGAVTLMGSKIGIAAGLDDMANGDVAADFDQYMKANDAAINHSVSQIDLDRWAGGLRGREEQPFLRGQACAGVALAQMDVWWKFRYGPTPVATGIPYDG